ncbi:hypothetical protein N9X52_01745 [Candidatus Poseidonia alphae]|nr:hypothetical protein [Candidatus Poseidonia alphae]
MFGEVDEHTTHETYLGHNMADAIACYHNGRWPTGLESLEQILGRQGNLVTADDMFLLMQNNIAVYNTVRSKCYAVRTCMPDPEHEHGGCTRQHRPGCQTFVPNLETGWKAYFRRGAGRHGECGACPIASETGLNANRDRSSFRKKTLELGVHRFNRITATDVLHLNYHQPAGAVPNISLGERGHSLKFNKPGALEEPTIHEMFRALAEDSEPKIDVDPHGTVFVDSPFVSLSSDSSDWETVYGFEYEEAEWEISITNFSPTRIRYFVGSVDPSQALHPFVERVPRGKVHDQRVRLRVEDSLLVWLPSLITGEANATTWEERLGEASMVHVEAMFQHLSKPKEKPHFFIMPGYPGVFLFIKNSKNVLLKPYLSQYLHRHGQLVDRRMLVPQFVQDVESIRFFWNGEIHSTQPIDDGGKPEFLLQSAESLDLLAQISRKSSSTDSEEIQSITYPVVEVYIFEHQAGSGPSVHQIKAKVKPNDFGFAWLSLRFSSPGQYHLCLRNTGDHRQRWIQVVVLGEATDELPFTYRTQGGDQQGIDAGQPWGSPPQSSREALLEFNKNQLLQGLDGLDEVMTHILSQDAHIMQLGHVAEIARLVFHHHSKEFQGHQTIQLGAFERRIRAILYNLKALYGFEVNSDYNLMRYLRALGEFEYWGRAEGYENHHKLVARKHLFGVWSNYDFRSNDVDQILDARPSGLLSEGFPSLHIDWESGIRFISPDDCIDLDLRLEKGDYFLLHPNENRVATTPDAFLKLFWGAVREDAVPLPPAEGWRERRWNPSSLTRMGERSRIPANRTVISKNIAEPLSQGQRVPPEWVKANRWHEISTVQVSPHEHLFLSLRYSDQANLDEVGWEMWLGCLDRSTMSERFVMLATRQANDEDQPWINELGDIGTDSYLRFSWLSDPKNALFDPTYLMREIARSIAIIVEREREEPIWQEVRPLTNRGLPGWMFRKHVDDQNLIQTRIKALMRYYEQHLPEDEPPEEEAMERILNDEVLKRFGWA